METGLRALLFVMLIWLAHPSPCRSQDRKPEPRTGAAGEASQDWEKLIYVPYKNLREVFEKEGAAAFMPFGKFLLMWERLRVLDAPGAAKPRIDAVITEAAYVGRVEKDLAHLEATLTVQVLGTPWVELPINLGEAAIRKVTTSNPNVLLQGLGNGQHVLLFPAGGEQKIQLDITARVRTSPDGRGFELECPPAGITTFELSVPEADQTIEVLPAANGGSQETAASATRFKANLGATRKITARWRPRVSAAPVMDVLASVGNIIDARIADGLLHTHATLTFQVQRGQLDQVRLAVPLEHRILDVAAAGLKSWKATAEEHRQVLVVDLHSAESSRFVVEVHTERALPEGAVWVAGVDDQGACGGIHALGEIRENGLVLVSHAADLALAVDAQSGLERIEPGEIPEGLRRPGLAAYKYYTPKMQLRLAARPVEPRLLVDHAAHLLFRDEEIQVMSTLAYTVERAGVFELRLGLPEGFVVDRVDCESMKEFQVPQGAGQLVVSLRERRMGQMTLVIAGHAAHDLGSKQARPLPILEPITAARENGTVLVFAPESLEIVTDEKGVQGAQPTRLAQRPEYPNAHLVSAWTYTRRPVIPVRTARKPTRLSAHVVTAVTMRQGRAEVESRLAYDVRFAGIDTFRLAVPQEVADAVQIESADPAGMPIKQHSRDETAAEGWVGWTVVLQREALGTVPLRVRYDLKGQAAPEAGQPYRVSVAPVRVLPSPGKSEGAAPIAPAAVTGEMAVLKERALAVAAEAASFEPIDVRELTAPMPEAYLAFRYFQQPRELSEAFAVDLRTTRHEVHEVVETVVSKALVELVVTDEQSVTYRCRYLMRTSERQRLPIELPKDSELLDALVSGRRVELERSEQAGSRDWDAYQINVARPGASDEPFAMALVFRAPFKDQPLRGRGGNLRLPLPRLAGAPAESSAAVQQTRAVLWIPKEFALVGSPSGMTPLVATWVDLAQGAVGFASDASEAERWFGDSTAGLFSFATAGRAYPYARLGTADSIEVVYWQTRWYTWWISGALVLAGAVLSRTTWENRLTLVLLAAFAGAMLALWDTDLVLNGLAAARFGLLAMLAWWVLSALARPRGARPGLTSGTSPAVVALAAVVPPPGLFEPQPAGRDPRHPGRKD